MRWDDLIRGDSHIDCASLSDPVLVREDGSYLYTLPSVVDDIDAGVTHIIRGEDHVTNTAVQIQLFRRWRQPPPHFAHHNLLIGADGQGLSKRTGALSIAGLREAGVESLAVAALATLTGSSIAVHPCSRCPNSRTSFDLAHFPQPRPLRSCRTAALSQRTLGRIFPTIPCATGWRRMTLSASRPSRSGSRCAATSRISPRSWTGGAWSKAKLRHPLRDG